MHRIASSLRALFLVGALAIVSSLEVASSAAPSQEPTDDWPQWLGPKRDGVWRESGILDKFSKDGAKIAWRTPIGGGYSGPAVAGDRVYVTDRLLAEGVK